MYLVIFTWFHVAVSLIAIGSGFVVMYGLLASLWLHTWTAVFLGTSVATSVTGYGFPFERMLPSHILGTIALVVLAATIPALYRFHLAGLWRNVYVIGAVMSLYLNFFVLIVQSFKHIPALKAVAPTQKEPPFAMAQLTALVIFTVLGFFAVMQFHPK